MAAPPELAANATGGWLPAGSRHGATYRCPAIQINRDREGLHGEDAQDPRLCLPRDRNEVIGELCDAFRNSSIGCESVQAVHSALVTAVALLTASDQSVVAQCNVPQS